MAVKTQASIGVMRDSASPDGYRGLQVWDRTGIGPSCPAESQGLANLAGERHHGY